MQTDVSRLTPRAMTRLVEDGVWDEARVRRAALSLSQAPGLAWLDGDGHGAGRVSFLAAEPVECSQVPFGGDVGSWLGALSKRSSHSLPSSPKPSQYPRWVGYLAYDAAWSGRGLELVDGGRAREARLSRQTPVAVAARYGAWLRIDHELGVGTIEGTPKAAARLRALLAKDPYEVAAEAGIVSATDAATHAEAILTAKRAIASGELYQVNLARTWRAPFEGHPLALWLAMKDASPVPLGFYFDAGNHQVLGRSMEQFLAWSPDERGQGKLVTRPIKGTLERSGDDSGEAARLRSDPKEHAEHVMIVDLMRNDLSRLAKTGSVNVSKILAVEPYAQLSHLVSTVGCITRAGTTLQSVLEATFPPGSVTGAPKVRAVAMIETLEPEARGIYCGAYGILSHEHSAAISLAVAIRTAVICGAEVVYRAGGGLVAASDVQREVSETELKARVFLHAISSLGEVH